MAATDILVTVRLRRRGRLLIALARILAAHRAPWPVVMWLAGIGCGRLDVVAPSKTAVIARRRKSVALWME